LKKGDEISGFGFLRESAPEVDEPFRLG